MRDSLKSSFLWPFVGGFVLGWRILLIALDRSASRTSDTPGPIGFFLRIPFPCAGRLAR